MQRGAGPEGRPRGGPRAPTPEAAEGGALIAPPGPGLAGPSADLTRRFRGRRFGTILADPPWRFDNRTGKVAPEHRRLSRYDTMTWEEIASLPVSRLAADEAHCYLWTPNALLPAALRVLEAWGFAYKSMLVWHKVRKDGGSDGRGVGFYFRNVTEPVLFGTRGGLRTLAPGRRQVNLLATRKREHSRKPDELYSIVEACSPGPRLELFARYPRAGWAAWGDEAGPGVVPRGRPRRGYGA
jgi:N6-adenosine-specific RNA methylase IME4